MLAFNRFIRNKKLIIGLWCSVAVIVSIKHNVLTSMPNNYFIFKNTYIHAIHGKNLYWHHKAEQEDKNHYGPFFSLFFAPFALMPDALGEFFFVGISILFLLWAIYLLPLMEWQKNVILLICLNELITAGFNVQFNIIVAGSILLTYILIIRKDEFWAPFPFLVAAFVKLYGIVALAFIIFIRNKPKFIKASLFWSIILLITPMLMTSPKYVVNMYLEWFNALVAKNSENVLLTTYQDYSVMGFFRRSFSDYTIPNLPFLIGGIIIFGLPYLRIGQYKNSPFQLLLLASTLMFPVLFSSSSESSTYIIAFVGIGLWFAIQPQPYYWYHWALLLGVIFFASLNSTDVYTHAFRNWLRLHSFKAVPCTLVWLRINYELLMKDFSGYKTGDYNPY
jgi:hypothetical protein